MNQDQKEFTREEQEMKIAIKKLSRFTDRAQAETLLSCIENNINNYRMLLIQYEVD